MCGIVGYAGTRPAAPIILRALRDLEYRGYDSAGIAVLDDGSLSVRKKLGKIDEGIARVVAASPVQGSVGIAHTRWATHGEPSDENSHPHLDGLPHGLSHRNPDRYTHGIANGDGNRDGNACPNSHGDQHPHRDADTDSDRHSHSGTYRHQHGSADAHGHCHAATVGDAHQHGHPHARAGGVAALSATGSEGVCF